MCHQAVGLIAGAAEERGIATVCLAVSREIMARVRPPRALLLDYGFGRPLGAPDDADLQRAILRAALSLIGHPGPPPVLEERSAEPIAPA